MARIQRIGGQYPLEIVFVFQWHISVKAIKKLLERFSNSERL